MGISRQAYYKRDRAYRSRLEQDQKLIKFVHEIRLRQPCIGTRKLHSMMHAKRERQELHVGRDRLFDVLRDHRQLVRRKRAYHKTTDSHHRFRCHPNLLKPGPHQVIATGPEQVWVADITYLRFGTRFFYLAVILDAYSRAVRGWALSRSLSQELTLNALKMALVGGKPMIFHSDQGSQYAAWLHTDMLDAAGIRISMSDKGKPTQNGIAERFMRTLKEEHVAYADYADFTDAQRQIGTWLEVEYNTQRIHSALNYATPTEFETKTAQTSSSPSV